MEEEQLVDRRLFTFKDHVKILEQYKNTLKVLNKKVRENNQEIKDLGINNVLNCAFECVENFPKNVYFFK